MQNNENELKSKIQIIMPEIEKSLVGNEDQVIVSGQIISRKEAERIYSEFNSYINSDTYQLPWNILPLKLVVSNDTWRQLQKLLNSLI